MQARDCGRRCAGDPSQWVHCVRFGGNNYYTGCFCLNLVSPTADSGSSVPLSPLLVPLRCSPPLSSDLQFLPASLCIHPPPASTCLFPGGAPAQLQPSSPPSHDRCVNRRTLLTPSSWSAPGLCRGCRPRMRSCKRTCPAADQPSASCGRSPARRSGWAGRGTGGSPIRIPRTYRFWLLICSQLAVHTARPL